MALSYEQIRKNVKQSGWICKIPTNTCVGFCDRAFVKGCPLSGTKMTEKDCEELIAKLKLYRNES